jgi:3-oxoadipate CoA-transferase, beta subunit
VDPWLVNAGKQAVTLRPGGSYFHHADSFAMIRGGHIDLCVLGAFEVAANGDIANWATSENDSAPAVGGAMDLGAGAKRLWVVMEHTTKDGGHKIVERCSYPLTTPGAVSRVYTNLGVLDVVQGKGFVVRDLAPGVTLEQMQAASGATAAHKLTRIRNEGMSEVLDERAESIRMIRDSAGAVAPRWRGQQARARLAFRRAGF